MTDFENFLDLENYDTVVLNDEEGAEIEFEKLAIVPMEDALYAILTPVLEDAEEEPEELEVAIFEVAEGEGGEVSLTLVTDEALGDSIMQLCLNTMTEEAEGEE